VEDLIAPWAKPARGVFEVIFEAELPRLSALLGNWL
jgi:hypothetical protein